MKDTTLNWKDKFKIEMWLVELKSHLECDAMIEEDKGVVSVYLDRAKEIEEFLNNF